MTLLKLVKNLELSKNTVDLNQKLLNQKLKLQATKDVSKISEISSHSNPES